MALTKTGYYSLNYVPSVSQFFAKIKFKKPLKGLTSEKLSPI
jgi:hypothetical protein